MTAEDLNSPETLGKPDPQPSAPDTAFRLAVLVMAVFPATLGIGFGLQSSEPSPGTLTLMNPAPACPNDIPQPPHPQRAVPDRSGGDKLLRDGRYGEALHHYRSLGTDHSLHASADLALRIGLCQEGLGQWDHSLSMYRSAADSDQRAVATAAVLGQARIWMRLNDFEAARPLLRSLLLQSGDLVSSVADPVPDLALLYSIALTEATLAGTTQSPDFEFAPVSNSVDWPLADCLALSQANWQKPATGGVSPFLRITLRDDWPIGKSANRSEFREDRQREPEPAVVPDGSADPMAPVDEAELVAALLIRPLEFAARHQSIAQIVDGIAGKCAVQLDWSEAARQRGLERIVDINSPVLPLSTVLTALCEEVGARWEIDTSSRTIFVTALDEDRPAARDRTILAQHSLGPHHTSAAALAGAMAIYPSHHLSGAATFALARLAAANGRQNEAARLYATLTRGSATPLALRAALNGALAHYSDGDLVGTCRMLEIVVHGGPGHELHTRSLILYGRALLDLGEYREAAFQLKRAAGSRSQPDQQAQAAVLLAMAQLLDGRSQAAAESLFAHRLQFQNRSVRNGAALMTSLARWRTCTDSAKDREASFLYRSVAAVREGIDWLGAPGQLLLGQAMRDVGLDDEMASLFSNCLHKGVPPSVSTPMKLALADYWSTRDRVAPAKAIWSELYAAGGPHSMAAGLRLADQALKEQQPEVCLELCQALQHRDGVPQTDVLKLAGQAYDQSGRPVLAAQCYAGRWPLP